MTTTAPELERPQFDRSEISSLCRLMADEVDPSADALDARCSGCQAPLSWTQWINGSDYNKETYCHRCGNRIFSASSYYEWPMPAHQEELVATPGYFDRRWFHASRRENWAEKAREAADGKLLVHAGSKLSALARADYHFRDDSKWGSVFLYSFELSSIADFSTTIYRDQGYEWPERLGDGLSMQVCSSVALRGDETPRSEPMGEGVLGVPYYNRYEVPGEISILFSAPLIDLDSVEVLELDRDEDEDYD